MDPVLGFDPLDPSRRAELDRAVASLLVVRASGHPADGQRRWPRWELDNARLQRLLERGVGGVILLGGSAAELRLRTRQLSAWAQRPLLLCADVEEGVGQRFEGASWLVPPLAVARIHREDPVLALDLARRYGACTGREARQLGLNWVLGPVCDVNNNPSNPVINVRAWGEDPVTAGALATAFCRGAQAEAVLCCAKHFPGHGDTSGDSHLELPLIPHDRARLEAVELPPFRDLIAAGVGSVMTAHLLLPALDAIHPATLSRAVLTGLLRRQLGFDGLIVTDALVMEAIAGRYGPSEAAVLALEAGADLVLMPGDPEGAIDAIVAAVLSGRLSPEGLAAGLRRRQLALGRCGAAAGSGEEPGSLDAVGFSEEAGVSAAAPLGALSNGPVPPDRSLALELVQRSLEQRGPALAHRGPGLNLLRIDNSLACPFLSATAPALALPAAAGLRPCLVDGQGPSPWSGDARAPLDLERLGEGPVLLQLFVRGNPFRGRADGADPWPAVIRQLREAGRLLALAVYGSPYAWEGLRPLLGDVIPGAWSPGQMPLAQGELLGRLGFAPTAGGGRAAEPSPASDFTD